MKLKFWVPSLVGLAAIACTFPAQAQSPTTTDSPGTPAVSTRAVDLLVTPRAGVGYSTSGGGYEGFGSFQGFLPLAQTPGKNLLYLVGQLLLDTDANLGGNVLLGYRVYNTNANRIFGGYLAYDNRDTGNNTFSQFGLGLETLGDGWDARLNAYVPVGSTRRTVSETAFNTGFQFSSFRFQNNFLLASGTSQQTRIRDVEAAMAGFDAEAGGRILRVGSTGDLRGYAGLYYIAAGDSAVGVRGRLEFRPIEHITAGLAVQHDGIFGTNVVATIALSFPNSRPSGAAPHSVLARMGEMPGRLNAIVVDRQRETTITNTIVTDAPARNPATGQPYVFQHVTAGASGGNGTVENPFGQVTAATAVAQSDNNAIVYVQAGSTTLQGFTIPDRVQVLSSASAQFIPVLFQGQLLPNVQLPLSGSGAPRPTVTGTVTMGSDTVLSGFNITSATGAGVTFNTVNQVEIRDNVIQNTASAGILGNRVAIANLFRNQIIAAQDQGVYLLNVGTANVTDNIVTNTRAGSTTIANPITGDITIGSITIPNPGSIIPLPSGQGIVIATTTGATTIARNTITGTGTQGIVLLNARGNASITDNTVANTVGNDFTVAVPTVGSVTVTTGQGIVASGVNGNLEINRNTVNAVRGQGITVAGVVNGTTTVSSNIVRNTVDQGVVIAGTSGTTTLANNQISDVSTRNITVANPTGIGPALITIPTGQGIIALNSIGTVNITGNTIERVAGAFSPTPPAPDSGQGIAIANFAGQLDLNITNNQVRNNFNDGILIGLAGRPISTATAATANITITGNTLENNGGTTPAVRGDGIGIGLEQDAVVNNLLIENNTIRNNGDEGIDIRLGLQAVTVVNPTSSRLTGTIRNNAIANNGQNGIQVQANGSTTATVTIQSNNASNNGQRGIFVTTTNGLAVGNPSISADIRLNTLTANANGFEIATTTQPLGQRICVNLTGNISTTPSTITNTLNFPGNVLSVVNLPAVTANNTGVINQSFLPAPTNTAVCP
ncbi:MAG: right-handed parallel beta-helix repeat-containing protein [Leptolyngbyaceae cyanobacterium bins.349]|nr:right-handed parallel beta-helix repeat-containing protein [Leptolyngbyaceae cyanobacterium bins.349]